MTDHGMRRLGWEQELLIGHMVADCLCGYRLEAIGTDWFATQQFYDRVWEHIAPYVAREEMEA